MTLLEETNKVRSVIIITVSVILVLIVMSLRTPQSHTITAIEHADWNKVYDYLLENPMPPVNDGLDGEYITIILSADASGNLVRLEPCNKLVLRSHANQTLETCSPMKEE